ncbi:transposase InsO family protein [Saccharothrix saharensis]|uniref:Transposase InsO family protein n=1 Tax=Saccharothrix saharensis TaxID=571190 RepID=A0A543JR01_9PSEU|nr:IS3 family transposase [Saccharothrix saharensis]TQM85227.1 transposase InsO family protein [Saccharothrix saharensis]
MERAQDDERLAAEIGEVHAGHRGAYGRPRIVVALRRRGRRVNHKRVGRVMRECGIVGITRRRRRSLTRPDIVAAPVPDLIGRDFTGPARGRRPVGDITYLPTREGWLYLATVIDLHNREVIGHAMAGHMRAEVVSDALDLAVRRGLTSDDAVLHADRRSQYSSGLFRPTLAGHGIRPSAGRTGSCVDNAVAESSFATLKTEIGTTVWDTREDARRDVFAYLGYYNHNRLHSTLGYRTPHEARVDYRQDLALVAQNPVSGLRGRPHIWLT